MLSHSDLYSLEEYSKIRSNFKKAAVDHRKKRQIKLGDNMTLHFEDLLTVKYQIQEMLLIEKTFTEEGIQDELDAYNALIPTGSNLKATLTIEYSDPKIRSEKLKDLHKVEDHVFLQILGHDPIYAIANEDMERSNDVKTSAVHFLRFEMDHSAVSDFQDLSKKVLIGVDHVKYQFLEELDESVRNELLEDFNLQK